MIVRNVGYCLFLLALLSGCGEKSASSNPDGQTPNPNPSVNPQSPKTGNGGSSNPAGNNGSTAPTGNGGGGTNAADTCAGTYRYEIGDQFQQVVLNADGSCSITNNSGEVESANSCRYSRSGTTLNFTSYGITVSWMITNDCNYLGPTAFIRHYRI